MSLFRLLWLGFKSRAGKPNLTGESDKTLLDIHIYWCDEDIFKSKYDKRLAALHERKKRESLARGFPTEPEYIRDYDRSLFDRSMMPWRYNQTVRWVRIYKFGKQQLRGDWWLIKAKQLGWQTKKDAFSMKVKHSRCSHAIQRQTARSSTG